MGDTSCLAFSLIFFNCFILKGMASPIRESTFNHINFDSFSFNMIEDKEEDIMSNEF